MEASIQTTADRMTAYFDNAGWGFERLALDAFRTGFEGENGNYMMLIRVTEFWIVFSINPYLKRREWDWGSCALEMLASLNEKIPLAKFGIDDDNDISLTVDFPAQDFVETHFRRAILTLGGCADQLIVPLLQICTIEKRNKQGPILMRKKIDR
jgi:hypothetical protein